MAQLPQSYLQRKTGILFNSEQCYRLNLNKKLPNGIPKVIS